MTPHRDVKGQKLTKAGLRPILLAVGAVILILLLAQPDQEGPRRSFFEPESRPEVVALVDDLLDDADAWLSQVSEQLLPTENRDDDASSMASDPAGTETQVASYWQNAEESGSLDAAPRQHVEGHVEGQTPRQVDVDRARALRNDEESEFGGRFWDREVTDEDLARERADFEQYDADSRRGQAESAAGPSARFAQGAAPTTPPMVPPTTPPPKPVSPAASGTPTTPSAAASNKPNSKTKRTLKAAKGEVWNYVNMAIDSGLFGGGQVSYLSPLREPRQVVGLQDLTTGQVWQLGSPTGVGAGARLWLGFMPEDQGFRFQSFTLTNDQVQLVPTVPLLAQPAFSTLSHVDVQAFDIEYIQAFGGSHHGIDTSFGVRFAKLSLQSNAVGYGDAGNGVSLYGLAMAANELQGIGFTGSLGGHVTLQELFAKKHDTAAADTSAKTDDHPYGWLNGWGLFCTLRGSVLWSESSVAVLTDASAVTQGSISGSAFSRNKAAATNDSQTVTGNFEMQVGFEYERCLQVIPSTLIFRMGLEYQRWTLGNLAANSQSQAFLAGGEPAFGGRVFASAQRMDDYLDMFGIAVSVGLAY